MASVKQFPVVRGGPHDGARVKSDAKLIILYLKTGLPRNGYIYELRGSEYFLLRSSYEAKVKSKDKP